MAFAAAWLLIAAGQVLAQMPPSEKFLGVHAGRFENKVCLVTGATSGLGEHAAYHLAKEGCAVVVTGRRRDRGDKVIANILASPAKSKLTPQALFIQMDVASVESVEAGFKIINETYGRLDSTFANAGTGAILPNMPGDETVKQWKYVMGINVDGVYYTSIYSAALMLQTSSTKKQAKGSMVLCSSIYGLRASKMLGAYVASKHALEGLKKVLAQEYVGKIRVNNVNPSFTSSELVDPGMSLEPFNKWVLDFQPEARLSEKAEVSSTTAWLLSDDAQYISGHSVPVDAGLTNAFTSITATDASLGIPNPRNGSGRTEL